MVRGFNRPRRAFNGHDLIGPDWRGVAGWKQPKNAWALDESPILKISGWAPVSIAGLILTRT